MPQISELEKNRRVYFEQLDKMIANKKKSTTNEFQRQKTQMENFPGAVNMYSNRPLQDFIQTGKSLDSAFADLENAKANLLSVMDEDSASKIMKAVDASSPYGLGIFNAYWESELKPRLERMFRGKKTSYDIVERVVLNFVGEKLQFVDRNASVSTTPRKAKTVSTSSPPENNNMNVSDIEDMLDDDIDGVLKRFDPDYQTPAKRGDDSSKKNTGTVETLRKRIQEERDKRIDQAYQRGVSQLQRAGIDYRDLRDLDVFFTKRGEVRKKSRNEADVREFTRFVDDYLDENSD